MKKSTKNLLIGAGLIVGAGLLIICGVFLMCALLTVLLNSILIYYGLPMVPLQIVGIAILLWKGLVVVHDYFIKSSRE
jgi:hypothetical protein